MEDPPRTQSVADVRTSHFMVRTSYIFKKVSQFRSYRRKNENREVVGAYDRGSRSMDLNHKAYMPQSVLGIASRHSADVDSDAPSCARHAPANAPEVEPVSRLHLETLPRTPKASHQRSVSAGATTALQVDGLPADSSTQSFLSRPQDSPAHAGMPERRNLAPRLATLPAAMMARYNAQGAARLTPSMVTRQPPMPIFYLPTLPPPTPTQPARSGRPRAPLRSIPALPMQGPSECEQEADHDNAVLGDSDEEDDADESVQLGAAEPDTYGDEDEDDTSSPEHVSPNSLQLPQVDTSSVSTSFLDGDPAEPRRETVNFTPSADAQTTPVPKPTFTIDYFSAKDLTRQSSQSSVVNRTPRPTDFAPSGFSRQRQRPQTAGGANAPKLLPMSPASPRPGLYHHGSQSMVDLLSISRKGKEVMDTPTINADSSRKGKQVSAGPPTIAEEEQASSRARPDSPDTLASPTLRRQRSLPTYKHTSEPPPYPSFHPRGGPPIQPRDEEGREHLPPYTNSIYLCAVMPRKVEFTQPGVQAKDRKWRRMLCILDGTVFKVYKCPLSATGVNKIEAWWEDKVGVGDITVVNPSAVTSSGIRMSAVKDRPSNEGADEKATRVADGSPSSGSQRAQLQPQPQSQPQPQTSPSSRSKFHLAASLLHPHRINNSNRSGLSSTSNSRSRLSEDIQREDRLGSPPVSTRQSSDNTSSSSRSALASGYTSNSTSRTTITSPLPSTRSNSNEAASTPSFFSRSRIQHSPSCNSEFPPNVQSLARPDNKDIIHAFTLQHAESGLASDYTKRKNVIRVRLEGEQFLLQAQDVPSVVEWIEGIQAATNIALDLDERPMPKGPMFPRRRRRRRPAVPTEQAHENVQTLRSPRPLIAETA